MHSSLILQALALFSIGAIAAPTPGGRSAAPTVPAIPEVPSSGPGAATLKHAVFNPVSPHFGSWNFFTLDDPRVDYWKRNPVMEVRYFKYCPKCGEYPFHDKYVLAEHLIKEDLATTGQGALDKANELPVIILALFTAVASSAPTSHAAVRARHVSPPEADLLHVVKRGDDTDFSDWQRYSLWDKRVEALSRNPELVSRYGYKCNSCGKGRMDENSMRRHIIFDHHSRDIPLEKSAHVNQYIEFRNKGG
ncbi:hypothetical protein MCOR02_010666 [Pyricularia oryzae]|nr:hypothetical protein MCOR02_010666 [Pyricularia oryzae]KAI6356518.1 hypothetical protein MCOR31_010738 [Pyricularia oryzae]KAI6486534.1 hypothetical protein MCOR13_009445 [Pyricularia oryzae]KAI6516320.1 hypothetical protein MCOR10_007776 [Pyricularia oryzae]KAI6522306.1 hypothetical protein MCOR16_007588 [Pyricularia oryzae]